MRDDAWAKPTLRLQPVNLGDLVISRDLREEGYSLNVDSPLLSMNSLRVNPHARFQEGRLEMIGSTGRRWKFTCIAGAGLVCLGTGTAFISGCSTANVSDTRASAKSD